MLSRVKPDNSCEKNQTNPIESGDQERLSKPNREETDSPYREMKSTKSISFCPCFCSSEISVESKPYKQQYSPIHEGDRLSRMKDNSHLELPSMEEEKRGMCGPLPWSILPVLLSITSCIGFVTTYLFAKANCHIERWIFPYLSYTGTEHPESMIFGLILNTEGFLGLIVVFLAWRFYRHMGQRCFLNMLGLMFGGLSCLGVIMVGNFQVTKAKIPHYIGAGLSLIIGTCYGVVSSILSRRVMQQIQPPLKYGAFFCRIRCGIAIVMVLSIICLSGVGMYKKLTPRNHTGEVDPNAPLMLANGSCRDLLSRIPLQVRYIDLLGSTTEWLLTGCILLCLSLFAYEFKSFRNIKVVLLASSGPLHCKSRAYRGHMTSCRDSYAISNISASRGHGSYFHSTPHDQRIMYSRSQPLQLQLSMGGVCHTSHHDTAETPLTSHDDCDGVPVYKETLSHNGTSDSGIEDNLNNHDNLSLSRLFGSEKSSATSSHTLLLNSIVSKSLPNICQTQIV
ncbi:uncharacterized protein LOC143465837 [Clavelina lepadiformis]|uniref:uncharacterized protein LOC143465837 n=1 Tax=Clavelina lepadiformis TaxID=159417 RepID=UPI0040437A60